MAAANVLLPHGAQLLSAIDVALTITRKVDPPIVVFPHVGVVTFVQSSETEAANVVPTIHLIPHTVSWVELPATVCREVDPPLMVIPHTV